MRPLRFAFAALALGVAALPAWARPAEVLQALPNAQKIGEARYQLFTVPIFRAELWAEQGAFSWERRFALTLNYDRSATERTMLNRAISEMSQRGAGNARQLAPLRAALERCFTNVQRSDRITGVSTGRTRLASTSTASRAARSSGPASAVLSSASGSTAVTTVCSAHVCAARLKR